LFLTLALVVLVIFLFLRNLSATIIPSLALPFSLVGTFAVMYALDYSLDNLSMMALTLSVGFVVDDAIVMLENIVRHMEKGTPPREAQHGRFYLASERVYERVLHWYETSLAWVMERRPAVLVFSGLILLATVVLFRVVPKGFLPSEDNSQIFGTTETVQGTSFDDLVRHQQQVMAVLQQDHNVDAVMSLLGGGQVNRGRVFMPP